jgi:hypothetical protein
MAVHRITTRQNYPWNPMNGVLDGPPHLSERFRKEKDLFPLLGIESRFLVRHDQSLGTTATKLSWPDFEQ